MSVDVRTRSDGPAPSIDPARFLAEVLPAALERHRGAIAPAAAWRLRPLAIATPDAAATICWRGDRADVAAGTDADGAVVWLVANRVEALFKPIGVVSGISDVPWHKDCSLGRHSYDCANLTTGISVTGAAQDSGQLRVRPGSHRALCWPALAQPGLDLPDQPLPTDKGDITVHLSCTLHMAQPPIARERRVLYTGFRLPDRSDAAARARLKLRAVREAAPVTVSQEPARSGERPLRGRRRPADSSPPRR